MFKKKNISAYNDLKTGFFCKLLLIIGTILLIIYIIQINIPFIEMSEDTIGALLAFAILSMGLGVILYFLSRQFSKLAEIAKEIENEDIIEDIENSD